MIDVKLEKLEKGDGLRTTMAEGNCLSEPEIGKSFGMVGKSLSPDANLRVITTSPVAEIEKPSENEYIITTETGSKYKITLVYIDLN